MFDPSMTGSPTPAAGTAPTAAVPHDDGDARHVGCVAAGVRAAVAAHQVGIADVVAGLDPDLVPTEQAGDLWELFAGIERLATAGMTLLARRVDDSKVWEQEGMRSAVEYLAMRSGTTCPAAANALATSRHVKGLPRVQAALRRGELSGVQAHPIADAAREDPAAEQRLLDAAKTSSIKELRDECLRVKAAADPDPEAKRRRQQKERFFRQYTDEEGAWCFSGRGAPENFGIFNSALNPIIDEIFREAWAEGRRERRQNYAFDGVIEMARRAYAATYGDDDHNENEDDSSPGNPVDSDGSDLVDNDQDGGTRDNDDTDRSHEASELTAPEPVTRNDVTSNLVTNETASGQDADACRQLLLPRHGHTGEILNRAQRRAHQRRTRRKRKQPNPTHRPVLRLDLEALRRGHAENDEVCEITDGGPISVPAARALLDESIVKLVITKDGEVVNVTHLGQGQQAAPRLGIPRSTRPETKPCPTHLALLHIDVQALAHQARYSSELRDIAGMGPVSVPVARELLGPAVFDRVANSGVAVTQIVYKGRNPTIAQRAALQWTQPTCSATGCPHSFTQIDHRDDWHRVKETTLDNLDRLCVFHHKLKTTKGWALVSGTGKRAFVPPDDPRHPTNTDPNRPPDRRLPLPISPSSTARTGNSWHSASHVR